VYAETKIALRYLFSKKTTNIINVISAISMIGVAIGTMALIIVLSVFNGFEKVVISLENSFNPDMLIKPKQGKVFVLSPEQLEKIKSLPAIRATTLILEENVLLKYGDRQCIATAKGVDENYLSVGGIDSMMVRGEFLLNKNGVNNTVLGAGIEYSLGISSDDIFKPISVYVPKRGKVNMLNPEEGFNRQSIYSVGTFAIQQEYDDKYIFTSIDFMRQLLNYKNEISFVELGLKENAHISKLKSQITEIIGSDFVISDRNEQNEFLQKIIKTERFAAYSILTFILLIASFNIVGTLTMLVIEKSEDIIILKAMGATNKMIKNIFLLNGIFLSLVGTTIGFFIAIVLCMMQQKFGIIKLQGNGSFVTDAYPVQMLLQDFVAVFLIVITIGVLAAWFPAKRSVGQQAILGAG